MKAVLHNDAWSNVTTGVGGPKDKSSGFTFTSQYVGDAWFLLEDLYEQDHIAGRIVDALPDAVFAEGFTFECSDQGAKEDILDAIESLEVEDKIDQAMRWERLHGGAAIFLGVNDGQRFDKPLDEDNVKELLYLHVFDKWEMTPHAFYTDPLSRNFGKPSHYRVHPSDVTVHPAVMGVVVHESRFIKFPGQLTTKRKFVENLYWGQSVLVRTYTAIKQYGGAMASVLALMADASQGVYKIKGLIEIIQGGNEDALKTRFQTIEKLRSILNAVLLDADGEDYAKIATQLSELGNIVDRFMLNVAAAANMPATEIFGRSAAGLSATGENDTRSWYKQVKQAERKKAKPAADRIMRILLCSANGPTKGIEPDSWSIKFPPAWSPSATEKASIQKTKMETAVLGHDAGVLTPEQIARGLFSGSEWDGEIVLTEDEIEALKTVAMMNGLQGFRAPAAQVPPPDDAPIDDEPEVQETTDAEGEALADLNPRELAQKMTELSIQRCEHGKLNRCQLCGVERERQLTGADREGNGVWATAWRAIGARAPRPEEPDARGAAT